MIPNPAGFDGRADIVIICMVAEVELVALRDAFKQKNAIHLANIDRSHREEIYSLKTTHFDGLKIAVVCMGSASNLDSGLNTLSLLYRYAPRYALLFGIAGGMQPLKYKLGSVVIGSEIVFRKLSKVTAPDTYGVEVISVAVTSHGQILAREFMADKIKGQDQDRISDTSGKQKFKVYHEKVFCWDLVLDCQATRDNLVKNVDRQLSVVEMEAGGFFRAIDTYKDYLHWYKKSPRKNSSNEVDGIVIRGISDYAAEKSNTDAGTNVISGGIDWRRTAAENAAQILVRLIDTLKSSDFMYDKPGAAR